MLYYSSMDLVVSDQEIAIKRGSTSLRLAVENLGNVHIERSDLHPLRSRVGHLVGALLVLSGLTLQFTVPLLIKTAMVLSLLVGTATYVLVRQSYPRTSELWANYRGADIRIYWSSDAVEFGRVARAVSRALAATRPRSTHTSR